MVLSNKETPDKKPLNIERTITWENPQKTLEEALILSNPENISKIVYDPDFKESDRYLRSTLENQIPEREIEAYLQKTRTEVPNHDLCVTGVISNAGDGQKRPVFARRNLLNSQGISSISDLENAISHEAVHAEEERLGYDFGDRRIKGEELTILFNKKHIRPEVICAIGEIDAYASQIEKGEKMERKPSPIHIINATINLCNVYNIIEKAIDNERLTPLERKYAEAKISKHKDTIEKLKKMR